MPVCHEYSRHKLFLAVISKLIPNHNLVFRQTTLQAQRILPVEFHCKETTRFFGPMTKVGFSLGTEKFPFESHLICTSFVTQKQDTKINGMSHSRTHAQRVQNRKIERALILGSLILKQGTLK